MITTPNHLHYPAAQQFINSGVAIMCDKPLVNEISEAEMQENTKEINDILSGKCQNELKLHIKDIKQEQGNVDDKTKRIKEEVR